MLVNKNGKWKWKSMPVAKGELLKAFTFAFTLTIAGLPFHFFGQVLNGQEGKT